MMLVGVLGVVVLAVCIPAFATYSVDRRLHGVDCFTRRRVRLRGARAQAEVLSCEPVAGYSVHQYAAPSSLVYEVRPDGAAPFRAKSVEQLQVNATTALDVRVGSSVNVRFDPVSHVVVLERPDRLQVLEAHEAERKAKEDVLLGRRSD